MSKSKSFYSALLVLPVNILIGSSVFTSIILMNTQELMSIALKNNNPSIEIEKVFNSTVLALPLDELISINTRQERRRDSTNNLKLEVSRDEGVNLFTHPSIQLDLRDLRQERRRGSTNNPILEMSRDDGVNLFTHTGIQVFILGASIGLYLRSEKFRKVVNNSARLGLKCIEIVRGGEVGKQNRLIANVIKASFYFDKKVSREQRKERYGKIVELVINCLRNEGLTSDDTVNRIFRFITEDRGSKFNIYFRGRSDESSKKILANKFTDIINNEHTDTIINISIDGKSEENIRIAKMLGISTNEVKLRTELLVKKIRIELSQYNTSLTENGDIIPVYPLMAGKDENTFSVFLDEVLSKVNLEIGYDDLIKIINSILQTNNKLKFNKFKDIGLTHEVTNEEVKTRLIKIFEESKASITSIQI
jgi:hypothetical protein